MNVFNLFEKQNNQEREISHPLLHLLIACGNWNWAGPKSGVRKLTPVSYVGGRDPRTWFTTFYLPEFALAGSWNQEWNQDLNLGGV